MTKYILHGGGARELNDDNESFFAEMTQESIGKTRILLNYFSRDDEEVEKLTEEDKERFTKNSENKDLEFEVADPNRLAEQLERSSVMYMRGGETVWLKEKISKTSDISTRFSNKVIAGSSAGVYVLFKYYWSNDHSKIGEGLGIFDMKMFCHYRPEDKEIAQKLLSYKEKLPLFTLPNYKWVVMYK